ncbi:MAG: ABC transporter permease, partial [Thermoleophilia bacterium]|nr:ABC transporter permease [Thermoleophilia bacterium]
MRSLAARVIVRWEALLVVAIVGVGIWSVTLSPFFLRRANLLDLVTPYVFVGLMAFGLTFVVITGEIDISVASTLAASIVCFAQIFAAGVNVWAAALIGLCIAAGLGLVNGLLVGVLNLPSLAVTLGTMAAYSGLAFVVLSGEGVATFPA